MSASLRDLITDIHVVSATTFDGKYTISEASLSDNDRRSIEEASAAGWIVVITKDDFGDYLIISVTEKGRREFRLLEVERQTFLEKALAFLLPAWPKTSR